MTYSQGSVGAVKRPNPAFVATISRAIEVLEKFDGDWLPEYNDAALRWFGERAKVLDALRLPPEENP